MQSSEHDVCVKVRFRKSAEAASTSGRLAFAVISTYTIDPSGSDSLPSDTGIDGVKNAKD
jgi:hypothetical protein